MKSDTVTGVFAFFNRFDDRDALLPSQEVLGDKMEANQSISLVIDESFMMFVLSGCMLMFG